MTTIITNEQGIRFRHDESVPCHRCDDPSKPFHSIGSCRKSTVLPYVHGWPLSGPAPQFLAEGPDVLTQDGDTILFVRQDQTLPEVHGGVVYNDGVERTLSQWWFWFGKGDWKNLRDGAFRCYLISRADRTADA